MNPKTIDVLNRLVYRYWNMIVNDTSQIEHGFHVFANNEIVFPHSRNIPKRHQLEWIQAMNIMSAYDVFDFKLEEIIDEDYAPTGNFYYTTSNFNSKNFINFCFLLGIDLQKITKEHKASLTIGKDNIPSVEAMGHKYVYAKRNESNSLRFLKVALAYPNKTLSAKDIQGLYVKTTALKPIINGEELNISEKTKFKRDFLGRTRFQKTSSNISSL